MNKPRILVLTAAGRTGMPVALQLLDEGFPVTAFVHKADQRSERLQAKGADIVVGSLTDINDMRTAMAGANRAYFCVPSSEGNLKAAALFTVVAAEQKLESVVAMSQWLSNPNHPAVHTREVWLASLRYCRIHAICHRLPEECVCRQCADRCCSHYHRQRA
ncbi:MAG TPA: NAD(P)H-binding protein [Ktedonobacteraceae bacterium]|nr:NAD(P)H-binding protein [Ktedonobacteraceae bacterium]